MSSWTVENNFFGRIYTPGNSIVLGIGNCSSLVVRFNIPHQKEGPVVRCLTVATLPPQR